MRKTNPWLPCLAAALLTASAGALESDEFTVPPRPLADLGAAVSGLTWDAIRDAAHELNREIDAADARLEHARHVRTRQALTRRLEGLRDPDRVARELHHRLGRGFPEVHIEVLVRRIASEHGRQPALYRPRYAESVFGTTALVRPLLMIGIVPTVQVHDVYMGTDKLGHMLQQGYEYYRVLRQRERWGHTHDDALRAAVQFGSNQEGGVFGYIPSGSYSHADLAANYAGLKLYLNLTRPVQLDGRTLTPLLKLEEGRWVVNAERDPDRLRTNLLAPLVSEHLNEAMNPPELDWFMRCGVEAEIAERAERWFAFHDTDATTEAARLPTMLLWRGEPYGHRGLKHVSFVGKRRRDGETERRSARKEALP